MGFVTQRCLALKTTYDIRDAQGKSVMYAQGTTRNPFLMFFHQVHFNLFMTEDSSNVGLFCRHHWHQVFTKFIPDSENGPSVGFGFPADLDPRMNAPVLATGFLLVSKSQLFMINYHIYLLT